MLRRKFGYSLKAAKDACDAVLENHRLELKVQDSECERILSELKELGAEMELKI